MDAAPPTSGYGAVHKLLHWATVVALLAQFVLGYALDRADDLLAWLVDGALGGEQDLLVVGHVVLGLTILTLAVVRLLWRRVAGLPPWAPGLSPFERRLAHRTERALYASLFAIPLTGIALVLVTGEDLEIGGRAWRAPLDLVDDDILLGSHIASHVVFFVAAASHVGLVLKHQLLDRDRLLSRMLRSGP